MADCGGDQCKSGQDQKRKQRPKSKGQTFLSKLPIIPVLFPGFAFHRCKNRPQNTETELHAQR